MSYLNMAMIQELLVTYWMESMTLGQLGKGLDQLVGKGGTDTHFLVMSRMYCIIILCMENEISVSSFLDMLMLCFCPLPLL